MNKKRRTGKGGEHKQAAHVASNRWLPDGVFDLLPFQLTPDQRDDILLNAKAKRNPKRQKFIEELGLLMGAFQAERKFLRRTMPAPVRDKMRRLQKHANALMDEIEGVDEYSTQLLSRSGRGPDWSRPTFKQDDDGFHVGAMPDGSPLLETFKGFTFNEAAVAVAHLNIHAGTVLAEIKDYPKHRLEDLAKRHLAYRVAVALKDHLGIEPTSSKDGIFSNVLRSVLHYLGDKPKRGVDKGIRDVRQLVSTALGDLRSRSE